MAARAIRLNIGETAIPTVAVAPANLAPGAAMGPATAPVEVERSTKREALFKPPQLIVMDRATHAQHRVGHGALCPLAPLLNQPSTPLLFQPSTPLLPPPIISALPTNTTVPQLLVVSATLPMPLTTQTPKLTTICSLKAKMTMLWTAPNGSFLSFQKL